MAVFSRELALRIGSAMVMAPLVLAAVWFGDPFFPCLIALAAVLMQAEWIRISETGGLKALEWVRIVVLIGALALGAIGGWAQGLLLLLVLAVVTSVIGHPRDGVRLWPALGTLYIGIPCLAMLWLRDKPHVGRDVPAEQPAVEGRCGLHVGAAHIGPRGNSVAVRGHHRHVGPP